MRKKTVILTAILFVILLFVPAQAYAAEISEEQYSWSELLDTEYQVNLAVGSTQELKLTEDETWTNIKWKSSDASVVSVSSSGVITGQKAGTAEISVYVSCGESVHYKDSVSVTVTDPKLSVPSVTLNLYQAYRDSDGYYSCYGNQEVSLLGVGAESEITLETSDGNLKAESYYYYGDEKFVIYLYPKKAGDYRVSIFVDGKKLNLTVYVRNLFFSRNPKTVSDGASETWQEWASMLALYPGEKTTLKLNGANGRKVSYKSSKTSVAKVNSKGEVTAKGIGYALITAKVDGIELTYHVGVSYKKSIEALRYATKHYGSVYSQEKRMQKGYYDCSSFVWRSYASAKTYVGPNKSWAPTAADMAQWCAKNGYMIYSGTVNMDNLLPGDLIFNCGQENGRYNGIYHVDLYQGNYRSITVESQRGYWGTVSNVMVARPCGTKASGVKASASGYTGIRISWNTNYGASGYQIYRSTGRNGTYKKIATVKKSGTYQDTKISYGKTYYYKVRPYWKASGKTYKGKFSDVVSCASKAVAPKVSLSGNAKKTVTLKWGEIAGADGYAVYRSTSSGSGYKKIKTIGNGKTVSFRNGKLKQNKTYYYKLKSFRKVNGKTVYSGYSNTIKVKVK